MSKEKKALRKCDLIILMNLAIKVSAQDSEHNLEYYFKKMVELIEDKSPVERPSIQVSIDGKEFNVQ